MQIDPSSIPDAWPVVQKFVMPEWRAIISPWVRKHILKEELNSAFHEICRYWLGLIKDELGENYYVAESDNFLLLTAQGDRECRLTLKVLEDTRNEILREWNGVAAQHGVGPHVVILFDETSDYYDYVSLFHPDAGEFGGSIGMMINRGYYHIVVSQSDFGNCQPVLFHELTHVLVAHLPLPLWLNECLALTSERMLSRYAHEHLTPELAIEHREYWNEETIQDFWNGEGFHAPDPTQKLCYSLARILAYHMMTLPNFRQFVLEANWKDAGQAAAFKYLGGSVGDVAAIFLGDGYWEPDWVA